MSINEQKKDNKRYFTAHLIRYRDEELQDFVWFWINPKTGAKISGDFLTQEDAEFWWKEMMYIHTESMNLVQRVKDGNFYHLKAELADDKIHVNPDCPFRSYIQDNVLHVTVLGLNLRDAKQRVEQYYSIKRWKSKNQPEL